MLERLVGRVLAAWVAADAVYGPDTWLRAWLEGRSRRLIWSSQMVWSRAPAGTCSSGSSSWTCQRSRFWTRVRSATRSSR